MARLFSVKSKPAKDKNVQFNKMLKRWKRLYEEAEVKQELISRQEFVKPSLKKRVQKQQAVRDNQRKVQLEKKENGK